jgi:hypothetical protein
VSLEAIMWAVAWVGSSILGLLLFLQCRKNEELIGKYRLLLHEHEEQINLAKYMAQTNRELMALLKKIQEGEDEADWWKK